MPGSGSVQLTGKLGDVLKESVEVALSWVKAHAYELGLTHDPSENIMKNRSIHVHCPSGAIPKVQLSSFRMPRHFLTNLGWPICRRGTYYCADLPLFWKSSTSDDCHDSKFWFDLFSWSLLKLFRAKCHFEVESLQLEGSRKSSSGLSELASRRCFYLLKTRKSKIKTVSLFESVTEFPHSVKDLPQEVKDGLEIIHVR